MNSDSDSEHRIVYAADTLYEQVGRTRFPTVDTVRRQARVSMNDANTVMKQWRRTYRQVGRRSRPRYRRRCGSPPHRAVLTGRWVRAQEIAGQSLDTVRAAWDAYVRKENSVATKWPKPSSPPAPSAPD